MVMEMWFWLLILQEGRELWLEEERMGSWLCLEISNPYRGFTLCSWTNNCLVSLSVLFLKLTELVQSCIFSTAPSSPETLCCNTNSSPSTFCCTWRCAENLQHHRGCQDGVKSHQGHNESVTSLPGKALPHMLGLQLKSRRLKGMT